MKREYQETSGGGLGGGAGPTGPVPGKAKMWPDEPPQQDAGVDELLAVLGYKVRNSDMVDVAQKLEQLEMMMGSAQDYDLLSNLASDTVHYNPSDLASWLQSMLAEVNPSPNFHLPVLPPHVVQPQSFDDDSLFVSAQSSSLAVVGEISNSSSQLQQSGIFDEPSSDYDLRAIPGGAICEPKRETKRMKPSYESSAPPPPPPPSSSSSSCSSSSSGATMVNGVGVSSLPTEPARPVVLVDSQENGIRLVHTLMACAEAVQKGNLKLAEALVKQIGLLAVSQAGAMRKVATYFAEALARRIYRLYPQDTLVSSFSDILEMHFYETCPYLKFAHFTANQAILEAFEGKTRVHVIDFSMKQGMQWPALMQALALRPGGPPAFRLTGIGPPQPDNTDALQQVGLKLAQLAETIHVEFEFRGFVASSLADLDASILDIRPSEVEAVAVNSVFELHRLLGRPGAIEKVLSSVTAMKPHIVTVVEQEANHNGSEFLERFNEALYYYSTLFDSLEGSAVPALGGSHTQDQLMSEAYLGRQICNVVACEGAERVERHETLSQWRIRMESAGFLPVHLGSNAFKQASMLLSLFGGVDAYRVEENGGCLTLGWHTRPLIATSAWQLASAVSDSE